MVDGPIICRAKRTFVFLEGGLGVALLKVPAREDSCVSVAIEQETHNVINKTELKFNIAAPIVMLVNARRLTAAVSTHLLAQAIIAEIGERAGPSG